MCYLYIVRYGRTLRILQSNTYSSGYEHQIIDFLDPLKTNLHRRDVEKKFIEIHWSVKELVHQFLSPLRMKKIPMVSGDLSDLKLCF